MRRGAAVPVLLGLLVLLVLASSDLGPVGPASPSAFLAVAILLAAFFALVVGAPAGRAPALLVAALPFLAYGVLETPALPGLHPIPAIVPWGVVVVALAAPALGRRRVPALVAAALTAVAVGAFAGWIPVRLTTWIGGSPAVRLAAPAAPVERLGPRRGAPVPAEGPHLLPATRGRHPEDVPLHLVFGAGDALTGREDGVGVFVDGDALDALVSPLELDAYDAVVVLPGAWPDDGARSVRLASAVASRARRGGVLVGPAPGRDWPPHLGRELGTAGRAWRAGVAGAQPFGLGRVIRATSEAGIREALAWASGRHPVGTVFDGPDAAPPPLPAPWSRWRDRPAGRRAQGILLWVYAIVAVLLDRVLRGAFPRFMGLVAPALAVAVGLAWISPQTTGVRAHAVAIELGGGGGRRVEAVALASGPAGWIGPCRFDPGGFVRVLGAHEGPDGLLRVGPGRTAWVVRETVARGRAVPPPEAREAGFLRRLLRGAVEPSRLRFAREGSLPVDLGALTPPPTWLVAWR